MPSATLLRPPNGWPAPQGSRPAPPGYDRRALTPAIVHLGVGGFHRAHQAVYLGDLARRSVTAWGERGVSSRHRTVKDALEPQDYIYTVVERGTDVDNARMIGVMENSLFAPEEPVAVLNALADPATRLVTLTVTRAGYDLDQVTDQPVLLCLIQSSVASSSG